MYHFQKIVSDSEFDRCHFTGSGLLRWNDAKVNFIEYRKESLREFEFNWLDTVDVFVSRDGTVLRSTRSGALEMYRLETGDLVCNIANPLTHPARNHDWGEIAFDFFGHQFLAVSHQPASLVAIDPENGTVNRCSKAGQTFNRFYGFESTDLIALTYGDYSEHLLIGHSTKDGDIFIYSDVFEMGDGVSSLGFDTNNSTLLISYFEDTKQCFGKLTIGDKCEFTAANLSVFESLANQNQSDSNLITAIFHLGDFLLLGMASGMVSVLESENLTVDDQIKISDRMIVGFKNIDGEFIQIVDDAGSTHEISFGSNGDVEQNGVCSLASEFGSNKLRLEDFEIDWLG